MMTTTTYNVATTTLEGNILPFKPHRQRDLPSFHSILNEAYGLSLYKTDVNFLFEDVATNGMTKLLKNAPALLRTRMLDHIKDTIGARLKSETDKVDNLFGKMILTYNIKSGPEY